MKGACIVVSLSDVTGCVGLDGLSMMMMIMMMVEKMATQRVQRTRVLSRECRRT